MRHGRFSNMSALVQPTTNCPRTELNSVPVFSVASELQNYINSDHPSQGQKIHSRILKIGFIPNVNISIKLLILYIKSSCLLYARQVFDEMPHRTLSVYNYMIAGNIRHGFVEDAFEKPDGYTFSMILKGSTSGLSSHAVAREVHAQIVKSYIDGDNVLYTALADSYVKTESIAYARRVFDLMLDQNEICSTSMITGYMNRGCWEEAEDVFDKTREKDVVVYNAMIVEMAKKAIEMYIQMQRLDFRPTISTHASVIGACSLLSAFEVGQQIQGQLMKTEFFPHIMIGSALIDMYSKCGRTEDARRVFDYMPKRNVFSWTWMIDGYGKNGSPGEALALFSRMINYVTFLGALSACGHAGLVAKGMEIFKSMEGVYSMRPCMEHYACVVDLLGRAGRLEFIMQMPEKPNSDVWAALLSSCRLHGDVELLQMSFSDCKTRAGRGPTSRCCWKVGGCEPVEGADEGERSIKRKGFTWIGTDAGLEAFHAGRS
uniref:Pentatricopeptide repeat protein n=1 Tax=Salvia miltiorrhiza TaxID=226208 RepID=A0A678WDR6_SALMI|nr:pentatricopeptide repeat protein [Salvia miltiorrhiza]